MGITIEKMYGSYSDADLNDWERFPINAKVLTSSAFGAWLLRRDERRDRTIAKDMVAMLTELKNELIDKSWNIDMYDDNLDFECCYFNDIYEFIQQKIDKYKAESER